VIFSLKAKTSQSPIAKKKAKDKKNPALAGAQEAIF
jgi:hypothetical protein